MKIFKIPYPRPSYGQYVSMASLIASAVAFILIFFQPFGTSSFSHPDKTLILVGYGICVFLTITIFYALSLKLIHRSREDRWTIVYEVLELFIVSVLSLIACYIYSVEIFDRSYSFGELMYFISLAASVAMLPVMVSLGYLYMSWKDVKRSTIKPEDTNKKDQFTLVLGSNKSDKIEASSNDIILAKAQNNYVMLYIQNEDGVQRHILRSTLKEIKGQLNDEIFLQAHRSYIINRTKIISLFGNKSKASLKLRGFDKDIPVSRKVYDLLKVEFN